MYLCKLIIAQLTMYSSQKEIDILFEIYKDSRTVFRINDIALLITHRNIDFFEAL